MRYFEKISYEQFEKDIKSDKNLYETYDIPSRKTKYAAGYDIYSLEDITIKSGEIVKIPTGLKANMEEDEVLLIVVRSSAGFKYNLRLCNQVGVIDKDYYNNSDNEGHIFIKLQNEGTKEVNIKAKEAICQGMFMKYLTVDNENTNFIEREGRY